MRQQLLDRLRIKDGFHKWLFDNKKTREAELWPHLRVCGISCRAEKTYLGGVTDAVAGFLLLKSLMKARVTSMLSAAYTTGT